MHDAGQKAFLLLITGLHQALIIVLTSPMAFLLGNSLASFTLPISTC